VPHELGALGQIALLGAFLGPAAVVDDDQLRARPEDVVQVLARLVGRLDDALALVVRGDDERAGWLRAGDERNPPKGNGENEPGL